MSFIRLPDDASLLDVGPNNWYGSCVSAELGDFHGDVGSILGIFLGSGILGDSTLGVGPGNPG